MHKTQQQSFTNSVLESFAKILREINRDSSEHDFCPKFGKYFVEGVLDYEGRDYEYEHTHTDITIYDENRFRPVVIETKRPKEDLDSDKWQSQAGKYADKSTRFILLTNGYRLLLWEVKAGKKELRVDLDFDAIINSKRLIQEKLTSKEEAQILFLENLKKEEVWSEKKYEHFNEYYATIDVSDKVGFEKLIERLNYVSNDLLRQYTYDAFDEYSYGYYEYQNKLKEIGDLEKQNGKNKSTEAKLAEAKMQVHNRYKKFASFIGYYEWRSLSNRSEKLDEENKPVFCKESIYVLLNRLLFIRICEDKGLLKKKRISNGGLEQLREFLQEDTIDNSNQLFKQILRIGYDSANKIYPHFFEKGNPLDWYESGDGELNRALNKTLWTLNQFDFSKVDKDILGKLYEKYLPKDERKKLGEFYTPDEVIDYILDSVGYEPSKAIDGRNLIDPACGSGGFLVRATRRLIGRYAVKFGKATPKESLDIKRWPEVLSRLTAKECQQIIEGITGNIHGFDINPFAVTISEMNLLFQVVDLYQKARASDSSFTLSRFQIHQTDSLDLPNGQTGLLSYSSPTGQTMAKDKAEVDGLKKMKYDYVVGNPPYVRVQELDNLKRTSYSKNFTTAKGNFDIYIPFIELGVNFLSKKGKLGYITSNQFFKRDYGHEIRKFLLENGHVEQIVNFQDAGVFRDATNYPAIFVVSKSEPGITEVISIAKPDEETLQKITSNEPGVGIKKFEINLVDAKGAEWILENQSESELKKVFIDCIPLKDLCEVVSGVQTGADRIYLGKADSVEGSYTRVSFSSGTEKIESERLIPFLLGRNIRRWAVDLSNRIAVFPYLREENGYRLINNSEINSRMPFAHTYLMKHKEALSQRLWYKQSAEQLHGSWYAYMYFNLEKSLSKLILTPALVNEPRFAPVDAEVLFALGTAGVFGVRPKKDYFSILGILNSKLIAFTIRKAAPEKRGGFFQLNSRIIGQVPIKLPETPEQKRVFEEIGVTAKQAIKYAKEKNPDLPKLEEKLYFLVFSLYGLNDLERKIVMTAGGT